MGGGGVRVLINIWTAQVDSISVYAGSVEQST